MNVVFNTFACISPANTSTMALWHQRKLFLQVYSCSVWHGNYWDQFCATFSICMHIIKGTYPALQWVLQISAVGVFCYQPDHRARHLAEYQQTSSWSCRIVNQQDPSCCSTICNIDNGKQGPEIACNQQQHLSSNLLITMLAGWRFNPARSKVSSTSKTYGSVSWLM